MFKITGVNFKHKEFLITLLSYL